MAHFPFPFVLISILSHLSLTTSQAISPTTISGNSEYTLLGCYSDLSPNPSSSPTYISPTFATPQSLTVPLCLHACRSSRYTYAAVTVGSKCYCLSQLSPLSIPTPPQNCNITCAGDPQTICGGTNFVTLYKSLSTRNFRRNTTLSIFPTPTPTNNLPISGNGVKNRVGYKVNTTKLWIGIAFGLLGFGALVFGILALETLLYRRRQRKKLNDMIPPIPPSAVMGEPTLPTIGDKLEIGNGNGSTGDELGDGGLVEREALIGEGNDSDPERVKRRATFEAWKKGVVPHLRVTPPTPTKADPLTELGSGSRRDGEGNTTGNGEWRGPVVVRDREGPAGGSLPPYPV